MSRTGPKALLAALLALLLLPAMAAHALSPEKYRQLRPSDEELVEWMHQPVLETIAQVDHLMLDDASFQARILDTPGRHMVVFLSDDGKGRSINNSRGMAALAAALKKIFGRRLTLGVYMVNHRGFVTPEEFDPLHERYGIRTVPQMQFYLTSAMDAGSELLLDAGVSRGIRWEGELLIEVDRMAWDVVSSFVPD